MDSSAVPMVPAQSDGLQHIARTLGVLVPYGGNNSRELSDLHSSIKNRAENYHFASQAPTRGLVDVIKHIPAKIGLIRKADTNIYDYKDAWVSYFKTPILDAAAQNDLPPELLAGTAHNEVGGKPDIEKQAVYSLRELHLPGMQDPDWTSFGDIRIQPRRAAASLGYDPANLSEYQHKALIDSLHDPVQNIEIVAKHLSDLRDREFPGTDAAHLTPDQIRILGARYNAGPDVPLSGLLHNDRAMNYGDTILRRADQMARLLDIDTKPEDR